MDHPSEEDISTFIVEKATVMVMTVKEEQSKAVGDNVDTVSREEVEKIQREEHITNKHFSEAKTRFEEVHTHTHTHTHTKSQHTI